MRRLKRKKTDRPLPPSSECREAAREVGRSEELLKRVNDQTREIMVVADRLRRLGDRNDFAARIREAMGGSP